MSFPLNTTYLDACVDLTKVHGELVNLGFEGIIRYCAPGNSWKAIREPEALSQKAHNLKLALVYESTAQDALKGTNEGKLAGAIAAKAAATVGLPPNNGSVLFASTDFDVTKDHLEVVAAYVTAFKEAAPGYGIGLYGNGLTNDYLFEKKIITVRWITQSMGFTGSKESLEGNRYELVQRLPERVAGMDTDPDSLREAGLDIGARVPFSSAQQKPGLFASAEAELKKLV